MNKLSALTTHQLDLIKQKLFARHIHFIDEIANNRALWHVRSNSKLGSDVFILPFPSADAELKSVVVKTPVQCENITTYAPLLDAWLSDEIYGEANITNITFHPPCNIARVTYNEYGVEGLWTFLDATMLSIGEIRQLKVYEIYSAGSYAYTWET